MIRLWTTEAMLDMARAFQPACVLTAAAELGVFNALAGGRRTAEELADGLGTDGRATAMLADALAALGILAKDGGAYSLEQGVAALLTENGEHTALAMVRHLANCLRNWAQLARVVKTGRRAERTPSLRGEQADLAAFIEAMDEICRELAPKLVKAIGPPPFRHLLDLGGGPGTWTVAFLRSVPGARATLFDLPDVIPIARRHIEEAGLRERVTFVAGDMAAEGALPAGADLAWVSAIVHMNSRTQNRALFGKVHAALVGGGQVLIRDVVMEESRTAPVEGALFAINMLVNTPSGGTYTLGELSEDLLAAGFREPRLVHSGEFMESVVRAVKP